MLLDFHRKMESWSFCQTLGDVFLANVGTSLHTSAAAAGVWLIDDNDMNVSVCDTWM
jgi:hypothetical protein